MVRQLPPFRSERKKKPTSGAGENEVIMVSCSTISDRVFPKITVPFVFQPKFSDFLLTGKHPICNIDLWSLHPGI